MRSIQTKLILLVGFLIFASIAGVSAFTYFTSVDRVERMLGERAVAIARTAAAGIDGDAHQAIIQNLAAAGEMSEWQNLSKQLTEFKERNNLKSDIYTYINAYWLEGQIVFIGSSDGAPFAIKGQEKEAYMEAALTTGKSGFSEVFQTVNGEFITGYAPIKTSAGEVVAIVEVALDTAAEVAAARSEVLQTVGIGSTAALLLGLLFTYLVAWRIAKPISALTSVTEKMAAGDLDVRATVSGKDEVGRLAGGFNNMAKSLQDLFAEVEQKNKDLQEINANLEGIVAERTRTIRTILENVQAGLLLINKDGEIQPGYSKSCESLLGTDSLTNAKLPAALGMTEATGEHFLAGLDQVFEDFLPEEITLDQLPQRAANGERQLSLEGRVVRNEAGDIEAVLFTILDITDLIRAEEENLDNRSIINILQSMGRFREFVADYRQRVEQAGTALSNNEQDLLRRELHTLKGNASAFGLAKVAGAIHKIEEADTITGDHIEQCATNLRDYLCAKEEILGLTYDSDLDRKFFQLNCDDFRGLMNRMEQQKISATANQTVKAWVQEVTRTPVKDLLGPMGNYLKTLASQSDKQIEFNLVGGDVRVDSDRLDGIFQNLVHLLRNALDHGVEPEHERGDKPAQGNISIEVIDHGEEIALAIKDDGRGIDHERVAAKALENGVVTEAELNKMSENEQVMLVFRDGLSTAEAVSETSGRGVGMSAVKAAVEDLGGRVEVATTIGQGTTTTLSIPKESVNEQRAAPNAA